MGKGLKAAIAAAGDSLDGKSDGEEALEFHLKRLKVGGWGREVCWHPGRKFRSDFVFLDALLIVEVEGGQSVAGGGRHQRNEGFAADCLRQFEAAYLGYTMLRFTTRQCTDGTAAGCIQRWLAKWGRCAM